ncbi:MAG: hypothetical protein RLZZ422_1976 [Pseudomonadota bacterium]
MSMELVRRILIIQVTRIGDTLLATPAIKAVAEYFPQAKITVLAHPKRRELFLHNPYINQVASITKLSSIFKGFFIKEPYDLAFVYGFEKNLVKFAIKVSKKVIAFDQSDDALNRQLAVVVNPEGQDNYTAVDYLLKLPQAVGINQTVSKRLIFKLTDNEISAAKKRLKVLLEGNNLLVGLQIASFSTKSYRDWPVEHFAQLAQQLKVKYPNTHFLIFGGKAEEDRIQWLAQQLPDYVTPLAGKLSLRETAACMSLLDLYVGIDTGPTHLMGCFEVPMVILYHHASEQLKPIGHPSLIVLSHPDEDLAGRHNMADIAVSNVLLNCTKVLGLESI